MDDIISRQAAIDALADYIHNVDKVMGTGHLTEDDCKDAAASVFEELPSVQTEVKKDTNVPINDCISRQAAIDAIERITSSMSVCVNTDECHGMKRMQRQAVIELANLPSAQPEQRWTPVKSRPMDDEERKEWSEKLGYDIAYDEAVIYSNLPEDGQECIVCTKWGNVFIDTFQNDPDYGCAFEEHGDMDGITAWMPLPKAWKEENR